MIYKMSLQDQFGNISIYDYDIYNNVIKDLDGQLLIEKSANKIFKYPHKISPDTPGKKSDIKTLKIQLGLKCNYSCSYSLQSVEIPDSTVTSNSDTDKFIKDLDKWLKVSPQRIEFWGGEPFVYWSKLKILIPELRAKYPNAEFLIITNGSLLDDEKNEFILDNNINIGISHDGPQQKFRGPDPFNDPKKFEYIKNLLSLRKNKVSFNTVLHSKNYNLDEIYNWFNDKFPNPNLSLEGVVAIYDDYTLKNIGHFTKEQYLELSENIFYELVVHKTRFNTLSMKMKYFIKCLKEQTHISSLTQKCGMDREDMIAVDLLGNVMTCQNTGSKGKHKIGSVYDYNNISLNTSTHFNFREECMHCPVVQLCKGSCMYLYDDYFTQSCWNEYYYNLGILKAALFELTGKILVNIEGDIRRPEYSSNTLIKNPKLKDLYL